MGRDVAKDVISGHPAGAGSVNPSLGAIMEVEEDHSEGELTSSEDEERIQGEAEAAEELRARLDAGGMAVWWQAPGQPGKSGSVSDALPVFSLNVVTFPVIHPPVGPPSVVPPPVSLPPVVPPPVNGMQPVMSAVSEGGNTGGIGLEPGPSGAI